MTPAPAIYKAGLTGGIGSGKSLVSQLLKDRGILVVDLDQLGHELLQKDPATHACIVDIFGPKALTPEGPDRRFIREAIFSDTSKKERLEKFTHPRIRNEFERRAQFAAEGGQTLIVCEAALLIEAGYAESLNDLVVVMADKRLRTQRVMERDKVSKELVEKMMQSQTSDSTRKEKAHFIIENDGTKEALVLQVDTLIERWKQFGWI